MKRTDVIWLDDPSVEQIQKATDNMVDAIALMNLVKHRNSNGHLSLDRENVLYDIYWSEGKIDVVKEIM